MNINVKINKKVSKISCGKITCLHKNGKCRYLGRLAFHTSVQSPFCCELLKIYGIKPYPLDCFRHYPYRACSVFEIK